MGILDGFLSLVDRTVKWLRGGERARPAQRRHGKGEFIMSAGLLGAGSQMGYPGGWRSDRIEQVLHLKHWVFVAIRAIQSEISGLRPRVAYVHDTSRTLTRDCRIPGIHKKSMGQVQEHEHIEPCGPEHPLVRLFDRPNGWDTAHDLWSELILFHELTGNSYFWTVPSEYGLRTNTWLPAELWVMPSHWVWPRLGPTGVLYYEVRPFVGPGTLRFPAEELIHVKQKASDHKIDGFSTLQAGAEWVDTDESINRSRYFQFKNGCFPTGAIELGEQYSDPDDQELERIYAKFFNRLQGEDRFGRPIITPPGAKYNPLVINPTEMAYSQSADQLRDWILALYGVPKEVAGIQDAGSEIAIYGPLAQFMMRTIAPKLRHLGQVLTRFLASRYDERLRVWWDDPTPQSPESLNAELKQDADLGMITPAEYRAARGRRPYSEEEEEKYSQIGKPKGGGGIGGQPPGIGGPIGGTGADALAQGGKALGDHPTRAFERNGHGELVLAGGTGYDWELELQTKAAQSRRVGEVWQGPSGRWFTRRDDGRVVPAKPPAGREKPKAEKKPAAKRQPKISPENARAAVEKMRAEGVDPDNVRVLARQLAGLTLKQLGELKKELGLEVTGRKAEQAVQIALLALSAVGPKGTGPAAARQGEPKESRVDAAKVEADLAELNVRDRRTGLTPLIPELYDRLKEKHPGLTEPAFHDMLRDMAGRDLLTLQAFNDPRSLPPDVAARLPDHPRAGKAGWVAMREKPIPSPRLDAKKTTHAVADAFRRLATADNYGLVDLADLKRETGLPVAELHAAVNELRRAGALAVSAYEGRHGLSEAQRDVAMPDEAGGPHLGYVSVADEGKLRQALGGASGPGSPAELTRRLADDLLALGRSNGHPEDRRLAEETTRELQAATATMGKDDLLAVLDGLIGGPFHRPEQYEKLSLPKLRGKVRDVVGEQFGAVMRAMEASDDGPKKRPANARRRPGSQEV